MKGFISLFLALFVVVWVAGAQTTEPVKSKTKTTYQSTPKTTGELKTTIKEATDEFAKAVKDKDIDAIMARYWNNPDLVVMYPESTYKGYDEVRNSWTKLFAENELRDFSVDQTNIIAKPDMAVQYGQFTMEMIPKSSTGTGVTPRGGGDMTTGKSGEPPTGDVTTGKTGEPPTGDVATGKTGEGTGDKSGTKIGADQEKTMRRGMMENMPTKGRFVNVWEQKDGKWVITLEHASFPMPSMPHQMNQMQDQYHQK